MWRNAGLVCPWATLCGDRASGGQTCGVVKCETSLPAATVCGDRAFRTPKHVVECEFLLGTGNPPQRSRRSDIQTCGKIWQNANLVRPGAAPSHEMRVNRQKLVQNCDFESSDASVAWKSNGNNCGKTAVF